MDLHQILLAATEVATNEAATESGGIIGTLGLNWKLFLAQLVNFSIVLFVFWKWIVKPLGKTLSDRQERIEKGLKYSEEMESEKNKFENWKLTEMKKIRNESDNILRVTTDTANQIKQETIVDAHHQANKIIEQAKINIESEKVQVMKEAKEELATLVVAASEKILHGKIDPKKDHELINESLKIVK